MKKLLFAVLVLMVSLSMGNNMDQLYVLDKAQIDGGIAFSGYDFVSQNSSTTYNFAQSISCIIVSASASTTTLNVVLPLYPDDGQMVTIMSVATINSLVLTAGTGDSFVGKPTSTTPSSPFHLIYLFLKKTWFRW